MFILPEIIARAENYASRKQIELLDILGAGKDGTVWRTNRSTALKIHAIESSYRVERNAYMRLADLKAGQNHLTAPQKARFTGARLTDLR